MFCYLVSARKILWLKVKKDRLCGFCGWKKQNYFHPINCIPFLLQIIAFFPTPIFFPQYHIFSISSPSNLCHVQLQGPSPIFSTTTGLLLHRTLHKHCSSLISGLSKFFVSSMKKDFFTFYLGWARFLRLCIFLAGCCCCHFRSILLALQVFLFSFAHIYIFFKNFLLLVQCLFCIFSCKTKSQDSWCPIKKN